MSLAIVAAVIRGREETFKEWTMVSIGKHAYGYVMQDSSLWFYVTMMMVD